MNDTRGHLLVQIGIFLVGMIGIYFTIQTNQQTYVANQVHMEARLTHIDDMVSSQGSDLQQIKTQLQSLQAQTNNHEARIRTLESKRGR